MSDARLATPSYLKYAFEDQHNLVVLFGAACFSLSFASLIPLAVGGGAEVLWLLIAPRLPLFRDWVDEQLAKRYLARSEVAIETALAELSEDDANRFRALSRNATSLVESAKVRLPAREVQLSEHGLLEVRRTFLDYLFLRQRVAGLVHPTANAESEQEALQLQQSYSAERDLTVRMTIRKALNAVQLRIRQQTALAGVSRASDMRLEMLEGAMQYLKGRLADPTFTLLAAEIDGALTEIGAADALELTLDQIFEYSAS